ncbi:MAG: hypothetical protein AB4368_28345 [Xenococcaceae cyanobacterium]
MSILLTFLGFAQAPFRKEQEKKQTVNTMEDRKEMKLAQLESYMGADDNQGIADLSLYF